MGGCEVVEVRCVSVRKDLQTLLKLATELQVPSLIHRSVENYTQYITSTTSVLIPFFSAVFGETRTERKLFP